MIITRTNFQTIVDYLAGVETLAVDTETTGLRPYHGDRLFSIIIADDSTEYYFNFQEYPDLEEDKVLLKEHIEELSFVFYEGRKWYFHNYKYDASILENAGIKVNGDIHDTMVIARILDNELRPGDFALDNLAQALGKRKDDKVKQYIMANKLYTEIDVPGKKKKVKLLHYDKVPFHLIVPYGKMDTRLTFDLGEYQKRILQNWDDATPANRKKVAELYNNEKQLLKTVYSMESQGIQVDLDYCQSAIKECKIKMSDNEEEFRAKTGWDFQDSRTVFAHVFSDEKIKYGPKTPTGQVNPIFDNDEISKFKHPAAQNVLDYRQAKSDLNYFLTFIYEADQYGVIHASLNQHGAGTGRFSSSNPNLQNLKKPDKDLMDKGGLLVRRAVVPRPSMVLHMLDFDQMEFRLALDYAAQMPGVAKGEGVMETIDKVLAGMDIHQATADVAGISRQAAKTVNFGLIYGLGLATLAGNLGVTETEAGRIKASVLDANPELRVFIGMCKRVAEKRDYFANWFGRRLRITKPTQYGIPYFRAPNYIIQGGCADIAKIAMVRTFEYLKQFRTNLILMIHDELVLEGPPEEAPVVVPMIKEIMEKAYPHKYVPLTCGVEYSFKSLADKMEGICHVEETA